MYQAIVISQEERDLILNASSTLEYLEDGRIWDSLKNSSVILPGSCIYEVEGDILLIDSLRAVLTLLGWGI